MALTLKIIAAEQVSYLPLTEVVSLTAQAGAVYTLVDANGDVLTEGLELRRDEDELELSVDGQVLAVIDAFFVAGDNPPQFVLGDVAVDVAQGGSAETLLISGNDTAIADGVVWRAGASDEGESTLGSF